MKAVIFAAGEGKRTQPLTLDKPKPLIEVLGKPLIQYTFEALPDVIDEVIMVVGYKAEQLKAFLKDEFIGRKVTYVVQEKVGGTGEALELARPYLGDGQFMAYYADDIYSKADAERLFAHPLGFVVAEVSNPKIFGVVEVAPDGHVTGFEEKPENPKSNLVSVGTFLLDQRVFDYRAPVDEKTGERYITNMIEDLAKSTPFYAVRATRWIPIGYPEDIAKAEALLKQG